MPRFDAISVGGGLAGATVGLVLARRGLRPLVVEQASRFKDRVRGEGLLPWGVNEARRLGIYDLLVESCGTVVRYWTSHGWKTRPPRDLVATTPDGAHCLTFYHPEMQEVLLDAACEAGAEVWRGAKVKSIEPGAIPSVVVTRDGESHALDTRLIVGADGRTSRVRHWGGFEAERDPERLVVVGLLLRGVGGDRTSVHKFHDSSRGEGALFFPLGDGRTRTYFIYCSRGERRGYSGETSLPDVLDACVRIGVPGDWLSDVTLDGPLAEFDGADTWVKRPYKNGVALVGDAASSNDPTWGNGLSLALRDVRELTERLEQYEDWDRAGREYAGEHERYFAAINTVTRWLAELIYDTAPDAVVRRERALAQAGGRKSQNPDYIALGPEAPSDDAARRRMFGEDEREPMTNA